MIIPVKISLLRPPKIKTRSPFRPAFASPKEHFPYDLIFNIKTTLPIRPLLGSPKGGLKRVILLQFQSKVVVATRVSFYIHVY